MFVVAIHKNYATIHKIVWLDARSVVKVYARGVYICVEYKHIPKKKKKKKKERAGHKYVLNI